MKKKIRLTVIVIAAAALLTGMYFAFLSPKAQQGEKSVTIQVLAENQNVNKSFSYKTSRTYLSELLKDEKDELKAETQNGKYGEFVTGMLGIELDSSKEYYNIKVNGKDATVGVSQLPLESGKTYTFTLTPL